MIRIKDYIFNENEIREIKQCKNYLRLDLTYRGPYLCINDANYEDIEWNYDIKIKDILNGIDREEEITKKYHELLVDYKNLEKENKQLEEENKKLRKQLLNYQMPPHNQNYYWTTPFEITCTAKGENNENN